MGPDLIEFRILHIDETVIFEFGPIPVGFFGLLVSSVREEVMWKLAPTTVEEVGIIAASMTGVRVPVQLKAEVMQALEKVIDTQQSGYPPVSSIVYGEVPDGYRETVRARPLVSGEKYCVLVFGEGLATARGFFSV